MITLMLTSALLGLASGHAIRGGGVGDVEVQERLSKLRFKLKRVEDMIEEKRAQEAGLDAGQDSAQSKIENAASSGQATAGDVEAQATAETSAVSSEEGRSDASTSTETSVDDPPQHVVGSTSKDLPSDRPLNLDAEKDPNIVEQRLQSSDSEIHQLQHDMDSALHPKNRFTHGEGAAILEKAGSFPSDDTSTFAPPQIAGAGTELEYPDISLSPRNSNADDHGDEWEASDRATQNMDGNLMGVQDLQNQMDQILSSPIP